MLLAVLAAATFGVADFYGGLAARRSPIIPLMIMVYSIGAVLMVAVVSFLRQPVAWVGLGWGAAAGVAGGFGLGLLYRGLAVGVMSVVAPVTAVVGAAIPVLFGLLLGDRLTFVPLTGALLGMVAIVLLAALPPGARPITHRASPPARQSQLLAIGAGVAIGCYFVLLSRAEASTGLWPVVSSQMSALFVFALLGVATRASLFPPRHAVKLVAVTATLNLGGTIVLFWALSLGPLGPVSVVTSLYPAATIAMATVLLHERLSRRQGTGLVLAALATSLMVTG